MWKETALPLHLSSVDTNGDNLITGEEMMVVFRWTHIFNIPNSINVTGTWAARCQILNWWLWWDSLTWMPWSPWRRWRCRWGQDWSGLQSTSTRMVKSPLKSTIGLHSNCDPHWSGISRFDDELGEALTDDELEKSLKDMDLDGNNVISYEEFLVLASSEIPEEW